MATARETKNALSFKEDFTSDFEEVFFCFVLFLFCFCFCFLSTIRKNHNLILYGSFHFMENEEFQVNSSLNNEIQPQTVP